MIDQKKKTRYCGYCREFLPHCNMEDFLKHLDWCEMKLVNDYRTENEEEED